MQPFIRVCLLDPSPTDSNCRDWTGASWTPFSVRRAVTGLSAIRVIRSAARRGPSAARPVTTVKPYTAKVETPTPAGCWSRGQHRPPKVEAKRTPMLHPARKAVGARDARLDSFTPERLMNYRETDHLRVLIANERKD